MLLVFTSCVVFAVLAAKKARVERQKATAARIEARGGKVWHTNVVERRDPAAPKWLLDQLGIDTFEGLGQIELMDTDVDDIAFLSDLADVKNLYLDRTRVRDLSPIASMRSLYLLSLDNTAVTDLNAIKDLQNLEILSISDTKIDDFRPLHGLKKLKTLYARRTAAPESEFDALREALPHIEINP